MSSTAIGIICILVFDFLMASKSVFLGALLQTIDPAVMLFATFLLSALWFISWQRFTGKHVSKKLSIEEWIDLGMVNLFTATSWAFAFYAYKAIEPAIAVALSFATIPVTTMALGLFLTPRHTPSIKELVSCGGIVGGIAYLTVTVVSGKSGLSGSVDLLGAGLGILAGVAMAFNNFFSKRLNLKGWNPTRILAQRLYALIALAYVLAPTGMMNELTRMSTLSSVLLVSVFGVIVPLWVFQIGILKLDPLKVSIIQALIPSMTLGVEMLDTRIRFSTSTFFGVVVVLGFTIWGVFSRASSAGPASSSTAVSSRKQSPGKPDSASGAA